MTDWGGGGWGGWCMWLTSPAIVQASIMSCGMARGRGETGRDTRCRGASLPSCRWKVKVADGRESRRRDSGSRTWSRPWSRPGRVWAPHSVRPAGPVPCIPILACARLGTAWRSPPTRPSAHRSKHDPAGCGACPSPPPVLCRVREPQQGPRGPHRGPQQRAYITACPSGSGFGRRGAAAVCRCSH